LDVGENMISNLGCKFLSKFNC